MPADQRQPFAHAGKPESAGALHADKAVLRRGVEAVAIVFDRQLQHRVGAIDHDADRRGCRRMLDNIGQPLLNDAVDRRSHFFRQFVELRIAAVEIGLDAVLLAPIAQVICERARQPQFIDRGGPQFPGDIVKRFAHLFELTAQRANAVLSFFVDQRFDAFEFHHDRGEVLAGAVVQSCARRSRLVFLRLHQPASQIRAFALGRDPLGNVLGDPIEPPRLAGFIDFDTALGA